MIGALRASVTTSSRTLRKKHASFRPAVRYLITSPLNKTESTLAILKPDLLANPQTPSTIIAEIQQAGIEIVRKRQIQWTKEEAREFYIEHQTRFFYHRLVGYMTSGPIIVMELRAPDVIKRWRQMVGKTHPVRMRVQNNGCLRSRFGLTDTRNGFHGSDSCVSAIRELDYVFHRGTKK